MASGRPAETQEDLMVFISDAHSQTLAPSCRDRRTEGFWTFVESWPPNPETSQSSISVTKFESAQKSRVLLG